MSDQSEIHSYLRPKIYVLHVEDDRTHGVFIAATLKSITMHEFVVAKVASLAAAVAHIEKQTPDVILLDLLLEDSDGIATVERMRDAAPLIPIVVTTVSDNQLLVQTAIRKGAQDYLIKNNINQDILNRTICNAIDRKQAANENHEKSLVLETILESTAISYWDWNVPNNSLYVSPGFKAMLGYAEDELSGHPQALKGLMHQQDAARVARLFDEHVGSRGAVPYEYVARYRHRNESVVWIGCRGKVTVWDKIWRPLRMLGCYIDISALDGCRNEVTSAVQ